MSRGRMLNKKISRDKDMVTLEAEAGPYGVIVFTWMIAHLDVEGRIEGELDVLKGAVAPRMRQATLGVIEIMLRAADKIGLIDWYEVDGEMWVSYPGFAKNQVGLRKDREPESYCPPPPRRTNKDASRSPPQIKKDASRTTAEHKKSSAGEEKLKEEKLKEDNRRVSGSVKPVPLGAQPPNWSPGEPLSLLSDFQGFSQLQNRWPISVTGKSLAKLKRLLDADPIIVDEQLHASEVVEAKEATGARGQGLWLGVIEQARKDAALEHAKGPAPGRPVSPENPTHEPFVPQDWNTD